MRRWIFYIHKYTAIVSGLFLLVIGLTGSVLAFEEEIAGVLYRDLQRIPRASARVSLADQATIVRSTFPGESFYGVRLGSDERTTAFLTGGKQVFMNGHTGEVVGVRTRDSLLSVIHRLHANLIAPGGRTVVTMCAFALVMLSVTGLMLWWREKSSPRLRTVSWRTHNAIGLWSNFYLLLLGLSTICLVLPVNPLIFRVTGSKPADRPARRSVVQPASTPISPDRAAEVAAASLPGLTPETVIFPFGPSGAYRVGMRTGESTLLAGDVQIDQYSGTVLAADRSDYSNPAMRIIQGNRSFHTGRWLGISSKILAALAGLAIAAQAVTGFLMRRRGLSRSR
jgi:uncharacterized iron-regulated membrane protein